MADGKVIIDTSLDSSGISKDLSKLGSIAKTGAKATVTAIAGITTVLGVATGVAINFGKNFETSLAKASTLFGDTAVDTANLKSEILQLSDSTGVAADAIGNSLYNALSAGIPVTEDMGAAMQYMEECSRLAKAGFTDVDTAVTSTAKVLNAYKMDVSDTGKVHKILMQTQNKGITTVGELGQSLAQVTPTAAAMNVQFEQVGASLATMTAQGTPTAQATTQLNSLFAELGKQGTVASKALESATEGTKYAGKGFSELMKEGVPLNEVLDLMGVKADMSDQSLIDMFGSIEAGKAALALSGENAAQFTENLTAMGTEADVVGEAYTKVMDTLEEKTNVAINSAKNLGIAIYQDMQEPLKNMADAGTKYLEQLATAFESNGIEGLVEEAGNVFADVAANAAEQAPKLVETAVKFIEAFVKGLVKNKDKLIKAAGDLVKTLANALIKLLPKSLQKPVKDAVDSIVKTLTGNSLKTGLSKLSTLFTNLGNVIGNIAKVVLPPLTSAFDFLVKNLDIVIGVVSACVTAFVAFKVVSTVVGFVTSLTTSMGVATTGFSLATAAASAFNAVLSALGGPVGLIITAVAALTVGIAAYTAANSEAQETTSYLTEAELEHMEAVQKNREAIEQTIAAREEGIAAVESEYGHYQSLWDELQGLVDANGRVKEGYEDRAGVIVGVLKDALGVEINLTDGVIENYDQLKKSIDQVIDSKKAEAIINQYQASYLDALKKQESAQREYLNAQQAVTDKTAELTEAQAAFNELANNPPQIGTATLEYSEALGKAGEDVRVLTSDLESLDEKLQNTETSYSNCNTTIQNYEGAIAALASGDADAIEEATNRAINSFKTAESATKEILANQVADMEAKYETLEAAVKSGSTLVEQEEVESAKRMWEASKVEYARGIIGVTNEVNKLGDNVLGAFAEMNLEGQLSTQGQRSMDAFITSISGLSSEAREAMINTVTPMISELEANIPNMTAEGQANAQALIDALKAALDIHSPSGVTKELFGYAGEGMILGLTEKQGDVSDAGVSVAQGLLDAITGMGLEGQTQQLGSLWGAAMGTGLQSQAPGVTTAGLSAAKAAVQGAKSAKVDVEMSAYGAAMGTGMVNSINSKRGAAQGAAKGLGTSVTTGYKSANTSSQITQQASEFCTKLVTTIKSNQGTATASGRELATAVTKGTNAANVPQEMQAIGTKSATAFCEAVKASNSSASSAGRGIASAAASALSGYGLSGQAHSVGVNFSAGLANGISAGASRAISAAINVASRALSAARNALDIHSPSKAMAKIGEFFTEGFAGGIISKVKLVASTVKDMASVAVDAIRGIEAPSIDVRFGMTQDNISAAARMLQQTVAAESVSMVPSAVRQLNAQLQMQSGEDEAFDYDKIADKFSEKIVSAMQELSLRYNSREVARMVREVIV